MKRAFFLLCTVALTSTSIQACGYGRPDPVRQFLSAKSILIGKVVRFENRMVHLKTHPKAKQATPFVIAVVKIDEDIKGFGGLTHVRVAQLQGQYIPQGKQVCLLLQPHHRAPVHVLSQFSRRSMIVNQLKGKFAREVMPFRKLANLSQDPVRGLHAKDLETRLTSLALVWQMNNRQALNRFSKEVRRAMLSTLMDAQNWQSRIDLTAYMTPFSVCFSLGTGERAAWVNRQVKTMNDRIQLAKAWCQKELDAIN